MTAITAGLFRIERAEADTVLHQGRRRSRMVTSEQPIRKVSNVRIIRLPSYRPHVISPALLYIPNNGPKLCISFATHFMRFGYFLCQLPVSCLHLARLSSSRRGQRSCSLGRGDPLSISLRGVSDNSDCETSQLSEFQLFHPICGVLARPLLIAVIGVARRAWRRMARIVRKKNEKKILRLHVLAAELC